MERKESLFLTFNHIAKASGCNYVLSIPMGDYGDLASAIAWKSHRSKHCQHSSRANLVIIYVSSSSMLYRIIVVHHVIDSRLYSSYSVAASWIVLVNIQVSCGSSKCWYISVLWLSPEFKIVAELRWYTDLVDRGVCCLDWSVVLDSDVLFI